MCGTGFSRVSRRQRDLHAWVSVHRRAVVQFVASGLWEQRDFIMGNVLGK